MKIRELIFKDFRPFYGEQSISFSMDPKKNVTLIHAENGVGKTTILNAVWWAFFGETTEDFEKEKELVNEEAITEKRTLASVKVYFEHDEQEYFLGRSYDQSRQELREAIVHRIEGGNHRLLPNPVDFINSVVPRELAKYFLFEGESAIKIFSKKSKATSLAVKEIIGCGLAEMAAKDIASLEEKIRRKIGRNPGAGKGEKIESEISSLETLSVQTKSYIHTLEMSSEDLELEKEELIKSQNAAEVSRRIQKERENFEVQIDKAKKREVQARDTIIKWTSEGGQTLLADRLIEMGGNYLKAASDEGILPAPHNKSVVEKLIQQKECICGTPLEKGSEALESVMKQLEYAADGVLNARVSGITGFLKSLEDQRKNALSTLNEAIVQVDEEKENIRLGEGKLRDLSKDMERVDSADIAIKERRLREVKSELSEIAGLSRGAHRKLGEYEQQITDLKKKRKDAAKKNKNVTPFVMQADYLNEAHKKLKEMVEHHVQMAKVRMRDTINEVLKKHARRDYFVKFGSGVDDFSLELFLSDNPKKPKAKSKGENQLLCLAFTSALVHDAKKRVGDNHKLYIPGTTAPVILDSPFGVADATYSVAISEVVPEMAEQVVIMVSSKQGSKEVLDCLRPKVGLEYILVSENRAKGTGKPKDKIKRNGEIYEQSIYGTERTLTTIKEI
jgi:DNA sulfur modification protein DndD